MARQEGGTPKATKERRERRSWPFKWPSVLILSSVVHSILFIGFHYQKREDSRRPSVAGPKRAPTRLVMKARPSPEPKHSEPQKILETPQEESPVAPKKPTHLGLVDHQTAKETRVVPELSLLTKKAGKLGDGGKLTAKSTEKAPTRQQEIKPKPMQPHLEPIQTTADQAKREETRALKENAPKKAMPKSYADLLPHAVAGLTAGEKEAGYTDMLDEDLPIGDSVDINTSEYRFIGYFSQMRQAIELVWAYPREAQLKNWQGEVGLQFVIEADGRVSKIKVSHSSGYEVLDEAIIQAIRQASPFNPLPAGIDRKNLVVTGSFRYVLNQFAH